MRTYETIIRNGRQVLIRTDGPPIIAADGKRCYKIANGFYASDIVKLDAAVKLKGPTMNKLDTNTADASIQSYTPGAMKFKSDEEVQAIIARGRTSLSNPPLQSEYEQNAQHSEAVEESLRRIKAPINNALSVPGRTAVQMQPNPKTAPTMRPAAPNASTMRTPASLMSDDALAAAATETASLPVGDLTSADYARLQASREARQEIARRATTPGTGKSLNPMGAV